MGLDELFTKTTTGKERARTLGDGAHVDIYEEYDDGIVTTTVEGLHRGLRALVEREGIADQYVAFDRSRLASIELGRIGDIEITTENAVSQAGGSIHALRALALIGGVVLTVTMPAIGVYLKRLCKPYGLDPAEVFNSVDLNKLPSFIVATFLIANNVAKACARDIENGEPSNEDAPALSEALTLERTAKWSELVAERILQMYRNGERR